MLLPNLPSLAVARNSLFLVPRCWFSYAGGLVRCACGCIFWRLRASSHLIDFCSFFVVCRSWNSESFRWLVDNFLQFSLIPSIGCAVCRLQLLSTLLILDMVREERQLLLSDAADVQNSKSVKDVNDMQYNYTREN